MSRMLVLAFHLGLLAGRSVAGVEERVVRIGVLAICRETVGSRYVEGKDLRVVLPGTMGKLEYLRLGGADDLVVEVLDWSDFLPAGVTVPYSLPLRLITTLEAGELPGVSAMEEASVRADRTVETESRSFRDAVTSSRTASIC